MAGLLAWAADVVGAHGPHSPNENDPNSIPLIFTPEQQSYVRELDRKANKLKQSIHDLRLRLPPPDISQRLPHLHAHSLASNAALALQLNAHSATREQTQLREETLQEENAAYEKALSDCQNKIKEKTQEVDSLRRKLEEINESEINLKAELENAQKAADARQSRRAVESVEESKSEVEAQREIEASKSAIEEKLDNKKKELSSMEAIVEDLEKKWTEIQNKSLKLPSPAQREKALDKQLHSLIEQLAAKQAQAEYLITEIHAKEKEVEQLNGLWKRVEANNAEVNIARNRFGRSASDKGFASSDYSSHHKPNNTGGRMDSQQRLMLLRSAFVLYILALHILVFIKISF